MFPYKADVSKLKILRWEDNTQLFGVFNETTTVIIRET